MNGGARTSTEQVRAEIARTRDELQNTVLALREEVRVRTDWRSWMARRPGLFLGAAFAVGFFLGYRRRQD